MLLVLVALVALPSRRRPGGTLATLRERIGDATAFAGLRVDDVVIEGRANTPEPLLRAALGVTQGRPDPGLLARAVRAQRIETLSWVEQATVERRLPDTVVVQLAGAAPVRRSGRTRASSC